jgi:hypothetical protein
MRYFIFFLFVLFASCGTANRHAVVQQNENRSVKNDSIPKTVVTETAANARVETKYFDTINFDPAVNLSVNYSMLVPAWGHAGYPSYIYSGEYSGINFTQLFITTTLASSVTVDSVSIQSVIPAIDTNPAAPVKVISKSTATILPDPKSSIIPYIVSAIAAVFLSTLFFYYVKRKKKNIDPN